MSGRLLRAPTEKQLSPNFDNGSLSQIGFPAVSSDIAIDDLSATNPTERNSAGTIPSNVATLKTPCRGRRKTASGSSHTFVYRRGETPPNMPVTLIPVAQTTSASSRFERPFLSFIAFITGARFCRFDSIDRAFRVPPPPDPFQKVLRAKVRSRVPVVVFVRLLSSPCRTRLEARVRA